MSGVNQPSPELLARAEELGIEASYTDSDGALQHVGAAVLEDLVDVLSGDLDNPSAAVAVVVVEPEARNARISCEVGSAELRTEDGGVVALTATDGALTLPPLPIGRHAVVSDAGTTTILSAPPTMPELGDYQHSLAAFLPAYALWSDANQAPSMAHVGTLARSLRERGTDMFAVLPLYAAFLDEPPEQSPYSPVSRLHWNEAYLDPDLLRSAAPTVDIPAVPRPAGDLVDWRAVWAARRGALRSAAVHLTPEADAALDEYLATVPDVAEYATFRASVDLVGRPPWTSRPEPDAMDVRAYELGQWLMDRSLNELFDDQRAARLVLDLPVGCHAHGYETWAHPDQFAKSVHVGAPPDTFFRAGQDWGFPPMLPGAGRRAGHDLWYRIIERAAAPTAILRIDHVMGVHRLWWIPEGRPASEGAYVRYPARELLAATSIAAARSGTAIVGEDLGTVPPQIRELMDETELLGMHEEHFSIVDGLPAGEVPDATFAGIRTHDMPAFAATIEDPIVDGYATTIGADRSRPDDFLDRVLDRLAASDAACVVVDIDDLMGERRAHNVPGIFDPDGWSRRQSVPVGEIVEQPGVGDRLERLARIRPST